MENLRKMFRGAAAANFFHEGVARLGFGEDVPDGQIALVLC